MSEEQTNLYREAWDGVIARDKIMQEALVKQMFHDMGKTLGFTHDYMPERILKSGDATIVFWEDGTKTVVKRSPDEPDNDYNAFVAALGIKIFGSNSQLKKIIKSQTVVQKPKKQKEELTKDPFTVFADAVTNHVSKWVENMSKPKDACPLGKPCEKSTVEHDLDAMNRHDEDWQKILDELPDSEKEKLVEALLKEAEGQKYPPVYYIFKAMSGEKDKELEDRLNKQAKKQYEEYLNRKPDKWKCPKCGTEYFWHDSESGRYSFCPKCQLASTDKKV